MTSEPCSPSATGSREGDPRAASASEASAVTDRVRDMAKKPPLWLQCACGLLVLSEDQVIKPRWHPTFSAKGTCPGIEFKMEPDPGTEAIRRARVELERRIKKRKLLKPTKRAYKQGPGTNPWDGVRSTTARPSKGSAGAPTLGKR